MKKSIHVFLLSAILGGASPLLTVAGDLDPAGGPAPTMHTLDEIYQELLELKSKVDDLTKLATDTGRFVVRRDGTIKDNSTGLIWLRQTDCLGDHTWANAKTTAASLAEGQCGLSDGSQAGDWRLPTRSEWTALANRNYQDPALENSVGSGQWQENDAFTGIESTWYWSSTTHSTYPENAYMWYSVDGFDNWHMGKTSSTGVWPVRENN